jgi:hypothetical protein
MKPGPLSRQRAVLFVCRENTFGLQRKNQRIYERVLRCTAAAAAPFMKMNCRNLKLRARIT